jgi:hypothetical protein
MNQLKKRLAAPRAPKSFGIGAQMAGCGPAGASLFGSFHVPYDMRVLTSLVIECRWMQYYDIDSCRAERRPHCRKIGLLILQAARSQAVGKLLFDGHSKVEPAAVHSPTT